MSKDKGTQGSDRYIHQSQEDWATIGILTYSNTLQHGKHTSTQPCWAQGSEEQRERQRQGQTCPHPLLTSSIRVFLPWEVERSQWHTNGTPPQGRTHQALREGDPYHLIQLPLINTKTSKWTKKQPIFLLLTLPWLSSSPIFCALLLFSRSQDFGGGSKIYRALKCGIPWNQLSPGNATMSLENPSKWTCQVYPMLLNFVLCEGAITIATTKPHSFDSKKIDFYFGI